MIGKFFHTPAARRFKFVPRFYDADKDEREERERRIREELGIGEEKVDEGKAYRPNVIGRFRDKDGWAKSSPAARKSQNKRLIILTLILALAFYLFFHY